MRVHHRSRKEMQIIGCGIETNGPGGWKHAAGYPRFDYQSLGSNEVWSASLRMTKWGVPWRLHLTICCWPAPRTPRESAYREVRRWAWLRLNIPYRQLEKELLDSSKGQIWVHVVSRPQCDSK